MYSFSKISTTSPKEVVEGFLKESRSDTQRSPELKPLRKSLTPVNQNGEKYRKMYISSIGICSRIKWYTIYKVYKRCQMLLCRLWKLLCKICIIPLSRKTAEVSNISLLITEGKIFFLCLGQKDDYLHGEVQVC